jgi:hypothetical protein
MLERVNVQLFTVGTKNQPYYPHLNRRSRRVGNVNTGVQTTAESFLLNDGLSLLVMLMAVVCTMSGDGR